jgi:hypothetical protein
MCLWKANIMRFNIIHIVLTIVRAHRYNVRAQLPRRRRGELRRSMALINRTLGDVMDDVMYCLSQKMGFIPGDALLWSIRRMRSGNFSN